MLEQDEVLLKKALTFWPHLSKEEQNFLRSNTQLIKYHADENIHSIKSDCLGGLIVKKGCIRAYMLSEKGKEITLYRLYSGEVCILSASCILQNITFDVQIDAVEDSELMVIPSSIFSKLIEDNIYVENFSYKVAVDKFSDVMWAMEQILFMSFDKRLAIFLLDEAAKRKSAIIPLTHEQIAKYIGSAREVVSRMLKYFVSEGLIELYRGGITIVDLPKLKQLAQQ